MDKYLEKFEATNSGHCIIKEELIISDDEEDNKVAVQTEPNNESFLETKSDGQIKSTSRRFGNKNANARNDKQSTLDFFLKSKKAESNESFEDSKNITNDENPKSTAKAAYTSDNIDKLLKKLTKSHCSKCNVKRTVIRRKARCPKCKTQLTYSCDACDKAYCTFTNLSYHLQTQHTANQETHPCPVCKKSFAFRKVMLAHRRINHDSVVKSLTGKQQCAKCGDKFESKHIAEHEKVCDKEAPFKCDKCSYATIYQSNLTTHVFNKHTKFKEKCKNCKKTFTNRKSMKRHLRVYCNKVKRFECHHCGHKLYRKDEMLVHIDQTHFRGKLTSNGVDQPPKPRICKYCEKTLDPYERMKYHLRKCESAPLNFRRQRSHDNGDDKSVRISCEYCGLTLKPYEQMRSHLNRCEFTLLDYRRRIKTMPRAKNC